MVHTLPDYTTKYKMTTIFGSIDVYEAAARLGAINTFDRSGNIIWYDNFEGAKLLWSTGGSGTGHTVELSGDNPCRGTQSMRLHPGSSIGDIAYATKYLPYPVTNTFGLEWRATYNGSISNLDTYIRFYNGTTIYEAKIRIDNTNDKIQYKDDNGTMQDLLTNCLFHHNKYMYNIYKLVINHTDMEYVRFRYNNRTADMTGYKIQSAANTAKPSLQISFIAYAGMNNAEEIYIDDVILTQNEPV